MKRRCCKPLFAAVIIISNVFGMATRVSAGGSDVLDAQQGLQCFGLGCPLNYTNNAAGQSNLPPGQSAAEEDDSVGLNRAIIKALSSYAGSGLIPQSASRNAVVYIPPATRPSGFYTLCQPLVINLPYNTADTYNQFGSSVKIDFSRAKFRALNSTTCPDSMIPISTYSSTTTPNCMIQTTADNLPTDQVSKDSMRAWLTGIVADGSSLNSDSSRPARFQCVLSVNAGNVTLDNGVLRNAKGGVPSPNPSAVLLLLSGGDVTIHDMKIGNYNDDCSHPTYNPAAIPVPLPSYDLENLAYYDSGSMTYKGGVHDSYIGNLNLVGAGIAGLEDTTTPGLRYSNVHAWGYNVVSGGSCNTVFQPKYSFELSDHNTGCDNCYADTPLTAYFHITQSSNNAGHVIQIHGGKGIGNTSLGSNPYPNPLYGFTLDPGVHVDIQGFDMNGPSNLIACYTGSDGSITPSTPAPDPISVISDNVGCAYTFGSVATASGTTTVNGNTILGNCNVSTLSATDPSLTMATGTTCYVYSGFTVAGGIVFKLPPAPPGTMLPIYVQPVVSSTTFKDASGGTSDVIGGPTSLPANCLIHALLASDGNWYLSKAC